MKRFCQTFLLLLLVAALVLPIVACGNKEGNGDTTGDGTEIDLTGISFKNTTKYYNGSEQTLKITGTLPTGVQVRYEYWNADNTEKVSDTGATEIGSYTVRAIFTKSGSADKTLTAKLVIKQGTPINLANVRFKIESADYDGEYHKATEKCLKGNSEPERTMIRFEYWNADNTQMVDDGNLGVKEAGIYTVRAIYSDPAGTYADAYVTAQLIISKSYTIAYNGPAGTEYPTSNPKLYSLAGINEDVILLEDATLEDHAFEGWYVDDGSGNKRLIKEISPATLPNGGNITLTAQFHLYAAYPKPYEYTTNVTEAPTALPAIPGYNETQKDAVCILDMSLLSNADTIGDDLKQYGIKYNNLSSNMDSTGKIKAALPAEGGGYGLQWGEYHWQEGGQYAASMEITKPNSLGYNLQNYDLLEFWVYSANATDQVFTVFFMTGGVDSQSMTFDVELNYSGWKKFSVRMKGSTEDLYAPAGIKDTISSIRFIGYPNKNLRSTHANIATEEMADVQNFIYFSNFYLTNYKSDFDATSNLPKIDLTRTLRNMAALTRKANLTDAEVADLIGKMNLTADGTAITADAENVFNDFTAPADTAAYKAIYERLYNMATAWKCTDSTYYQSEALLNAVVAGMNFMAENSYALIAHRPALDDNMADSCLYIADVMNIFGDYLSAKHAQSWGALVLEYYPSSIGTSTDAFLSSYIYASIQMALGNVREAITGFGQLVHAFSNREIVLTSSAADLTRFTILVSAMTDNMVTDSFVTGLFNWFYDAVDAMLVDGKTPAMLSGCDIVPYIRALLVIYPRAEQETQKKFASYIKMYMEKDAGLAARLAAAQVYDAEATSLAAILASTTASAVPSTEYIGVYEAIGTAIYKTQNGYLLITPNGVYANGIDASAITATPADSTFYGTAANGAIALVRGQQMIAIYNGTVTVADVSANSLVAGDDTVKILIVAPAVTNELALTDSFFALAGAPMIAISEADTSTGNKQLTVYAYAGQTTLCVNGVFKAKNLDGWTVAPDADGGISIITINPDATDTYTNKPVGKIISRTLEVDTTAGA